MSEEPTGTTSPATPVLALEDPRVVSILNTEHWNLLSNRALAYNEAFTRAGMFLTFLSMSFVALALLAQGMGFTHQFLIMTTIVLAFDLVIGLTTYGRITGANIDDLRAVHGMARIRQAYIRIAPVIGPYLTSPVNDDMRSLAQVYGDPPTRFPSALLYTLMTSGGMVGLITSMVGGVLAAVFALLLGFTGDIGVLLVGLGGAAVAFVALMGTTMGQVPRAQEGMGVAFPTESERAA